MNSSRSTSLTYRVSLSALPGRMLKSNLPAAFSVISTMRCVQRPSSLLFNPIYIIVGVYGIGSGFKRCRVGFPDGILSMNAGADKNADQQAGNHFRIEEAHKGGFFCGRTGKDVAEVRHACPTNCLLRVFSYLL